MHTLATYALVVAFGVVHAACAAPNPPQADPPSPASVVADVQHEPGRAVRYQVEIGPERWGFYDLTELYLPDEGPDAGIACNVSDEASIGPDRKVQFRPVARAFRWHGPRNQDRNGNERPTERIELPADLVAQLFELATLTARQHELALQLGPRLAPFLPAAPQK